jgi:hypothetical protein
MTWSGNKAPDQDTDSTRALAQWVEDELERFSNDQIDNLQAVDLRPTYNAPTRPRAGMFAYADGTKWNPGYGEGPYYYNAAGVWGPMWRAREKVLADRTIYVRTDGNDANNGLLNTAAGAFLTIQAAWDYVCNNYDFGTFVITIQVADGAYTAGIDTLANPLGRQVIILGNTTTPGNVTITKANGYCFRFLGNMLCRVQVRGFNLSNTGSAADLIRLSASGYLLLGNLEFGACTEFFVAVLGTGANVQLTQSVTYLTSPAGLVGYYSQGMGQLFLRGIAHTFAWSTTYTTAFVYCDVATNVLFNGATFVGTDTVTITIATPGVVTRNAHGLADNAPVRFNTSGALPTGLVVGTEYYVVAAGKTANTFSVSAAPGGAAINTSGTQSGTHKGFSATGVRYFAQMNSTIFVNGAGATYIPGSTAGTLLTGSQYG